MTQTWAIFYDAYRSLNAKKMFWVVLVISGLVVGAFALVGINERGLKIAIWQLDTDPLTSENVSPALCYKWMFVEIGIAVWLGWIGSILALISTAGIFPDLMSGGSIDLLVSKPIGRLRLFLTQYATGLLFVTLQVGVFSLAGFLVIGFRGGAWEPGLFMAIPLVVCFFSYLFSVCVFLGIVTRSTLASLLLTLVFWFFVYGVGAAENALLMFRTMAEQGVDFNEMQRPPQPTQPTKPTKPSETDEGNSPPRPVAVSEAESSAADHDSGPTEQARLSKDSAKVPRAMGRSLLKALAQDPQADGGKQTASGDETSDADDKEHDSRKLEIAHDILYGVKTFLPKTTETIALLERTLIDLAELPEEAFGQPQRQNKQAEATKQMVEEIRSRSVWWVVGTSLLFEAFVLAWAALIFCRRDF